MPRGSVPSFLPQRTSGTSITTRQQAILYLIGSLFHSPPFERSSSRVDVPGNKELRVTFSDSAAKTTLLHLAASV